MPLPDDLPIVDHHCHLAPDGEGVRAAERFRAAGGTHLFLATQQYRGRLPRNLEEYRAQFDTTVELARAVERETGVVAYPVVAPYPVDLVAQSSALGVPEAVELQRSALDLAGAMVEAQTAVALGEVGRLHFDAPAELAEPVEAVLRHALEVGRDVGCPVVLHGPELDAAGFRSMAALAAAAGFPPHRLVKHYHRTVLPTETYLGIVPSYLARRETVAAALATEAPWFLETDFLDDPRRPGAVLDLATVPKRARQIADGSPAAVERLRIPFQRSIELVYGFTPEALPGGGR